MAFVVSTQPGCGSEGCHAGVAMSDDEFFEGYAPDLIYKPCACHPKACIRCRGAGWASEDVAEAQGSDDCAACDGSGWIGAPEHPDFRYSDPVAWRDFIRDDDAPSTANDSTGGA